MNRKEENPHTPGDERESLIPNALSRRPPGGKTLFPRRSSQSFSMLVPLLRRRDDDRPARPEPERDPGRLPRPPRGLSEPGLSGPPGSPLPGRPAVPAGREPGDGPVPALPAAALGPHPPGDAAGGGRGGR